MFSLFKHCRDQKIEIMQVDNTETSSFSLLSIASSFDMVMKIVCFLIALNGRLPAAERFISICRRSPLHGLNGHYLGSWCMCLVCPKIREKLENLLLHLLQSNKSGQKVPENFILSWDCVGTWILYDSKP